MNRVLVSYVPYMMRDYVMTRGSAMAVVAALFLLPQLLVLALTTDTPPDVLRGQGVALTLVLTPFLTLIATYGLLGQDFRLGFYRPLFAKPISVPLYYATLFCCAAVSFWLIQALVLLVLIAFGIDAWDPAAWLDMSLRFALLGTLTFAMSRVTRLDWLFAFFLFQLAGPMRRSFPAGESIGGFLINVLFPPAQLFDLTSGARADGQFSALIGSGGAEWVSIVWLAGYAMICVVIGLWAVRGIPLASVQ